MIYTVKLDKVIKAETARDRALDECVLSNPKLFSDFQKTYPNWLHADTDLTLEMLNQFVLLRGLKVVNEKPEATIDKNGFYRVTVTYQIEEPEA